MIVCVSVCKCVCVLDDAFSLSLSLASTLFCWLGKGKKHFHSLFPNKKQRGMIKQSATEETFLTFPSQSVESTVCVSSWKTLFYLILL